MSKTKADTNYLTSILVFVLLAVALAPTIYANLKVIGDDSTNFSSTELAIFSVFGIVIAIGILYKILKKSGM